MTLYEIKKAVLCRGGKLTLLVFACVIAVSCWLATLGVEWMNEEGEWESGMQAARKLRAARQEWKGYLDEEALEKVIGELNRITAMPEYTSEDYEDRSRIRFYLQGIAPIRQMFIFSYSPGYQEIDETVVDRLTPADAASFYGNRTRLLKEGLCEEDTALSRMFSERQKQFLIARYESLKTPFSYDYVEGWQEMLQTSNVPILCMALVLSFLVAGIFANEFRWKADAVYFSSRHGRDRATVSKILACFLLVSVLYWLGILIYTLSTLCWLGFDGGNCPIQISFWKSIYHLTYQQAYLLAVAAGYVGNLFAAFAAMWISAKTRSSVVAVSVPFCILMLPAMFRGTTIVWLNRLADLLPDQLMQYSMVLQTVNNYDLGFAVVGRAPLLIVVYAVCAAALAPMLYRTYRRKSWC